MQCWKCHKDTGVIGRVEFRAECPHCEADLHCCKQCKFYKPGQPNDCLVPGTEWISNREKANLCEEFKPNINPNKMEYKSREDVEKRLFGD
jgi:hypothetical protein